MTLTPIGPVQLWINHVERAGMEWSATTEEVLGGTGRTTFVVQDRDLDWEPECHWPVEVKIRNGPFAGWCLFYGEIETEPIDLPVGYPFRAWKLDCADWNIELPRRLVGAYNGKVWQDIDGMGDYINIDPNAQSLASDKLTVQRLLDAYIRIDGQAFEAETYVEEYISDLNGSLQWSYATLQSSLEEMAQEVVFNLPFWGDPDLSFHWVSIPSWKDLADQLAQVMVPGYTVDSPVSMSASMFPEIAPHTNLPPSIYHISDVYDPEDPYQIGCRMLKFTLDGSTMPEQIYVRGSTGYTYDAPSVNPTGGLKAISPAGPEGFHDTGKYQVTVLAPSRLYSWDSTHTRTATAYDTIGACGPYDAKYVYIPPNNVNTHWGHYWQFLTGPYTGRIMDNDTNYFGWGTIKVQQYVATTSAPVVGTGGSGWVNEIDQDKNKRQAYRDVPISSDHSTRDAVGGQALYRANWPTLRGSLVLSGREQPDGSRVPVDGWRCGQIIQIIDARLPSFLNGKFFLIQAVKAGLLAGTDEREYTIDWGDGPTSRYTYQPRVNNGVTWPNPANMIDIQAYDLAPGVSSTQVVVGQLTNKSGGPWAIPGKVVNWSLEAYNSAGTKVDQGTLAPLVSIPDANGKARTKLTTSATSGIVYFVFADCPVT